ncbi:MAG: hypothetical protein ACYSUK_00235 [Planctomycetota bacterium]|jgi:hypothetical protein
MKLKPTRYIVDLIYKCPHCENERCESVKWTRSVGKFLCDVCDKVNSVDPVIDCDVVCKYADASETVSHPTKPSANPLLLNAVSLLVDIGYKKNEAKKKVELLAKNWDFDLHTDEDFYKAMINETKNV